jgi:hypothetical protein
MTICNYYNFFSKKLVNLILLILLIILEKRSTQAGLNPD